MRIDSINFGWKPSKKANSYFQILWQFLSGKLKRLLIQNKKNDYLFQLSTEYTLKTYQQNLVYKLEVVLYTENMWHCQQSELCTKFKYRKIFISSSVDRKIKLW